jgi:GNAT superfamily N-acetyltransferase
VEIRTARPDEAEALCALHRSASYVWTEDHALLDAHPDVFGVDPAALAAGQVRVAVDADGRVLGFATVSGDGELDDLFVEPEHMRHGIGRALVEDAAARARADGRAHLRVVAAERTLPFYSRAGFAVTGDASTRFGPALRLERRLP